VEFEGARKDCDITREQAAQRITRTLRPGFPKKRSRMSGSGSSRALPRNPVRTVTGRRRAFAVDPALLSMPAASASTITLSADDAWLDQSCTGSSTAKPVEVVRTV
jgi:hypothetical protein